MYENKLYLEKNPFDKRLITVFSIAMQAFKTTELIHSDVLTIRLPNDFINKNVEIIVLALEDKEISLKLKREQFRKKMLSAPIWSDEEINLHLEARKHLEKWNTI